jgi:hypothetical protein
MASLAKRAARTLPTSGLDLTGSRGSLRRHMTKFGLYFWLTGFLRPVGRLQSARQPASGLWLLPWNVPPLH